jgi:hypothetical protein
VVRDTSRPTSTHADLQYRGQGYIKRRPVNVQTYMVPFEYFAQTWPTRNFFSEQASLPKVTLLSAPVQGRDWNVSSRQAIAASGVVVFARQRR